MPYPNKIKDPNKGLVFLPLTFIFIAVVSGLSYYFLAQNPVIIYDVVFKDKKHVIEKKVMNFSLYSYTPLNISKIIAKQVNDEFKCGPAGIFGVSKLEVRGGIAYLWLEVLGHPGRPLAPVLGVHPAVVYQAARRGASAAATWQALLGEDRKVT